LRGIKLSVKGCFTGVFVVLVERFESCRGHVYQRGGLKVRLDPPQVGTPNNHMHLEFGGKSYDIFLNPVDRKSPAAHIPIR
jgi:hypothetical protein